jgi:hypothetical protein
MAPRVFFDGNAGDPEDGFLLIFDRSKSDLESIEAPLHDGMKIVMYDPGQVEVEAKLKFDQDMNCWRGIPIGPFKIF